MLGAKPCEKFYDHRKGGIQHLCVLDWRSKVWLWNLFHWLMQLSTWSTDVGAVEEDLGGGDWLEEWAAVGCVGGDGYSYECFRFMMGTIQEAAAK